MEIFVVTSQAQEEDNVGIILTAMVRIYGVYSDRTRADAIATKYRGTVKSLYLDKENIGDVLQQWVNPGYVS